MRERWTGTAAAISRSPRPNLIVCRPDHVWRAVQILKTGEADHRFGESTDYDVITDDGMRLPPKAVFGIAASEALGFEVLPKHFASGVSSICFRKIRSAGFQIVTKNATPVTEPVPSDPADRMWAEGRPKLVTHLKRERRSGLAEAKKAEFLRQHGRLFCERCQIDPKDVYGAEFGDACIEVHHDAIQVSEMDENHETTLDQLKCLCANCHRVVHSELRVGDRFSLQYGSPDLP